MTQELKMDSKLLQAIEKEQESIIQSFTNPPKKVRKNTKKELILFHGTSEKHFKKIREQGIMPRKRRKSNWEGIGESRNNLVYLTNCYACYYASVASDSEKGDEPIILKIKVDPTKIKLYVDEEFIYHALSYNRADNKAMAEDLYQSIDPKKIDKGIGITGRFKRKPTWEDSLNYLGTVSCDFIPPESIMGYATLSRSEILRYCDPTISVINYKIMGGQYARHLNNLNYKKL